MEQDVARRVLALWGHSCVAALLGVDGCKPQPVGPDHLELDHVRPQPPVGQLAKSKGAGGFGKRPRDDVDTLMPLCWFHHQGGNPPWAPTHRPLQRELLDLRTSGYSLEDVVRYGREVLARG